VANLDGTSQQQITPYGLAEPHEIVSAQWSPDGRVIISATTQGRLFIIRPDGTSLAPIRLQQHHRALSRRSHRRRHLHHRRTARDRTGY
jgi:Tol biopolymer transport system component